MFAQTIHLGAIDHHPGYVWLHHANAQSSQPTSNILHGIPLNKYCALEGILRVIGIYRLLYV